MMMRKNLRFETLKKMLRYKNHIAVLMIILVFVFPLLSLVWKDQFKPVLDYFSVLNGSLATILVVISLSFVYGQLDEARKRGKFDATVRVFQSLTDEGMTQARRELRAAYRNGELLDEKITPDLTNKMHKIWVSLDNLGILVAHHHIDYSLSMEMFHDQAIEFWCMLEKFILRERNHRRTGYQIYFERFYKMCLDYRMNKRRTEWHAVVFDLDGLLINTEQIYTDADRMLVEEYLHLPYDLELKKKMVGLPALKAFSIMADALQVDESPIDLYAKRQEYVKKILAAPDTNIELMPGVEKLLRSIKHSGMKVGLATSSDYEFAKLFLEKTVVAHFENTFDVIITTETYDTPAGCTEKLNAYRSGNLCYSVRTSGKPNPDIYMVAAQLLEVDIDRMVVFEDSPGGYQAASAAGAFTIAIPTEYSIRTLLQGGALIVTRLSHARIYSELGIEPI